MFTECWLCAKRYDHTNQIHFSVSYFGQSHVCVFTETSVSLWYAAYLTHSNYLSQELSSKFERPIWSLFLSVSLTISCGKQEDARKIALKVRDCFLANGEGPEHCVEQVLIFHCSISYLSEHLKRILSMNSVPPVEEALKKSIDNGPLEMTEVMLYSSPSHWNGIFSWSLRQLFLFPLMRKPLQTCLPGNTDPETFSFQSLVELMLLFFSNYMSVCYALMLNIFVV